MRGFGNASTILTVMEVSDIDTGFDRWRQHRYYCGPPPPDAVQTVVDLCCPSFDDRRFIVGIVGGAR
jgi:hypothetical protein